MKIYHRLLQVTVILAISTTAFFISTDIPTNELSKLQIGLGIQPADAVGVERTWNCTCILYSDEDGSYTGKWTGKVRANITWPRNVVEKAHANSVCEKETARQAVNCKRCSCGYKKGKKGGK